MALKQYAETIWVKLPFICKDKKKKKCNLKLQWLDPIETLLLMITTLQKNIKFSEYICQVFQVKCQTCLSVKMYL